VHQTKQTLSEEKYGNDIMQQIYSSVKDLSPKTQGLTQVTLAVSDAATENTRPTTDSTVAPQSQQKSLAVNICVLPLSGSWSYRAID